MLSQQQLQMQLMQLQLQQQHSGCMTDASMGGRALDVSTASLASATSMGSTPQASLMRQFSIDSAGSSSSQLPQLMQQQQETGVDCGLGAAAEQQMHLPLQLIAPDGLSLNPAGPYVASKSGRVAAHAARPAGAESPAAAAVGGAPGARLSVVQEAAAAAGVRPGSGSGSGVSVPIFRDGSSSSSANSSITYAPSGVISPSCTSFASPEGWSPAVATAAAAAVAAAAVSASPGMAAFSAAQMPMQQQYVANSPAAAAAAAAHLEGVAAQLQQLQLSGASPARVSELLATYSAQAEITRQQAVLAQAAAAAAKDRLVACMAALGSNSAESMTAIGAAHQAAAVAAGISSSPHAQQMMVQLQQPMQQQQQMVQSEQLMILLDDSAAGAAAAPMLASQGSAGLLQQQYVLHGTPQASAENMMPHHNPTTSWM
jgi:hypothetical protein